MIIYKPIPKIQAMTFDLDDTLYYNWPYIVEAERALLDFIAKQYPDSSHLNEQDWQQFRHQALRDDPQLFSDMGDLRLAVLTKGLSSSGYQGQTLNKAVQTCFDYFYYERSNFRVSDAVCQILERLSEKVPMIAITNGNVNTEQIGIHDYFQKVLKANRKQPMKPHPHMFEEAANFLNTQRTRILHVGDSLEKDVLGAANAGFSSAWHACDRPMNIQTEYIHVLPNIEIHSLEELLHFIPS